MQKLTDDEIHAMRKDAQGEVQVCCDEYHRHSALQGCLRGDHRAIDVCKLAETVLRERAALREAMERMGEPSAQ